jgi:putative DNA primase/helicase
MTIQVGDLDRDPWLLNCNNGTLDLRTGELHSHRRSDLITKCTNVDYDPSASSLTWEQIRWNMTGGDADLAAYLQRVAGYALTGVATEKKFFFLYGPPDSGKSTFIVSLMAAMGDYARATPFETWIDRPNPLANRDDLVSLQGVRLVTSGEVAENKHWDTSLLKQVTGGDTVVAQAKYEKPIEFIPSCTVMMAANSAPKARDDDDGFWNRCHRIPIRYVVPKEQRVKDLHAQLRTHENQRAILAWAVEGCAAWLAQGIGNAHVVSESTAEYREDNDWIGAFLEMYATDDEYAEIGTKIFRSQYEEWCKGEGQRPEATKTLARRIAKRHPTVRYVMVHGRRVWKGIRLREEGATRHEQEPQAPIPSPTELPPLQHDFGFTPDPEEETPW